MAEKDLRDQANERNGSDNFDINTDENLSGTTHLNEPLEEESELQSVKAELEESKDKYLRLVAEFDNFRRRTAKERGELIQIAGKDVISGLLDVLDDADRAQQQLANSEDKSVKEGVSLVFNKLRSVLQSKGLKPMNAIGTDFNPDMHEAITEIPAPAENLIGKVVDEVTKGYYLNDKIIRHAKVVVGK